MDFRRGEILGDPLLSWDGVQDIAEGTQLDDQDLLRLLGGIFIHFELLGDWESPLWVIRLRKSWVE